MTTRAVRAGQRRRAGARAAAALGLIALVAGASSALAAAPAQRVLLLRAPEDDPPARQVATLLAAELKAAGFEIIEVDRDPHAEGAGAVDAAWARLQPVAALLVTGARRDGERAAADAPAPSVSVDLWVEDPSTRQRTVRRIAAAGGARSAADLALKAVEILRGSLLEVTVARSAAPVAPAASLERPAAGSSPPPAPPFFAQGFGVSAGAVAWRGTGVGASVAPMLRLGWGGARGYLVRLSASGLGSVPEVRAAEGVARVRQTLIEVEGLRAFRAGARWQPLLGAGLGVHRVAADGTGVSSLFPSGAGSKSAAVISGHLGIALRLDARWALTADAGILWLAPATKILIADHEAARVGGASAQATVSLFARF